MSEPVDNRVVELENEIKERLIELLDIRPELLSINYAIDQQTDISIAVCRYTDDWWSVGTQKYYYNEAKESIPEKYWLKGARTLKEVVEMEQRGE